MEVCTLLELLFFVHNSLSHNNPCF